MGWGKKSGEQDSSDTPQVKMTGLYYSASTVEDKMDKITSWLDAYLDQHETDEVVSISHADRQRALNGTSQPNGRYSVLVVMRRV